MQKGIFHPWAAETRPYFYQSARDMAVPNMMRLLEAARQAKMEVVHTVIQSLTADGRDRSLTTSRPGSTFHRAAGKPSPVTR